MLPPPCATSVCLRNVCLSDDFASAQGKGDWPVVAWVDLLAFLKMTTTFAVL